MCSARLERSRRYPDWNNAGTPKLIRLKISMLEHSMRIRFKVSSKNCSINRLIKCVLADGLDETSSEKRKPDWRDLVKLDAYERYDDGKVEGSCSGKVTSWETSSEPSKRSIAGKNRTRAAGEQEQMTRAN
ncbi:hypothetical protein F511_32846 [Dorcoceras hygrometricum]|uniref:Uncharacterized protein n=1 Tax=Dorcoceras hygrometricum TaxID=472368 RepID=A0A2Z7A2A1_9LAMI|nr:hypothetical protein F511_32846 [Dorcoceras hygrometricum]